MKYMLTTLLALFTSQACVAQASQPVDVGDQVPNAILRQVDGSSINFTDVIQGKRSLVLFYRGGWCPYCNTHLAEIEGIRDQLAGAQVQIIAISPDKPEELSNTITKNKIGFRLLSDSPMRLATAFGIAFTVDDQTIQTYKKWDIDLERASGYSHHQLPHPAAFLIDENGNVTYRYSNADYKKRAKAEHILKALANPNTTNSR